MIQKEVIANTKLSNYIVTLLSKKYSLGELKGKSRHYSEEDILFLQKMAHYRKHRTDILKLFNLIKRYPGIEESVLKKKAKLTNYRYNIALVELTHVCYLWEDVVTPKSSYTKPIIKYYIDGDFFAKYLRLFNKECIKKKC
jgi:hypothetical protein